MSDESAKPFHPELVFLVVDDDDAVRATVKEQLHSFGYLQVLEAPEVQAAKGIMETAQVDFVISDWEMPGLSGLEFLRYLRFDERFRGLPFIMITAPISHENIKIEEAAMSDVDAYIIKPFLSQTLRDKINEVLIETAIKRRRGALVVDDDASVREVVAEILDGSGYSPIYHATDGEEGYQQLTVHSSEIAIVISDWEMPRLSGLELLRKIRIDRDLSHTPFLMMTSQSSMEALKVQKAIEADVDQYVIKPFTVEVMRKKIEDVVERARRDRLAGRKLELAAASFRDGDFNLARVLYRQVMELDARNIDAHLGLARVRMAQTQGQGRGFEECTQLIKAGIAINPRVDRGYVELAHAFEMVGSLERAVSTLRDAFTHCPVSATLHFELGKVLLKAGKTDKAVEELQRAVELKPDHGEARKLLYDTQIKPRP